MAINIDDIKNTILCNDCENLLKNFPSNCIDTIITDPPYALKFKNNKWDYSLPHINVFTELLRIIKPGGTMLIFGGTRTFHRLAVNIEDSGWYISDVMCWLYGQGFPKSVDISYMIDKNRNSLGSVVQKMKVGNPMEKNSGKKEIKITGPNTDYAKLWYGWGTALKPAWEPIIVCNKHIEGNYDDNAIKHGVAGYWIDGARIQDNGFQSGIKRTNTGRWPSNLLFDEQSCQLIGNKSRFFYCSKENKKDNFNNHPTVKPFDLIKYLCILTRTPTGGIVLDPYAGSGTTALACIETKRDFIVIEKENEYCDIIKKRINGFVK
jgi:DNA modification methylase